MQPHANNQIQSNTMQYHAVQSNTITLPEAERTQGIESVTWIIFFSLDDLKLISVRKMMQVIAFIN